MNLTQFLSEVRYFKCLTEQDTDGTYCLLDVAMCNQFQHLAPNKSANLDEQMMTVIGIQIGVPTINATIWVKSNSTLTKGEYYKGKLENYTPGALAIPEFTVITE